jgi:hypothetical protein
VYAHWKQVSDRERMHAGVLRDIAKEQQELAAKAAASGALADVVCESGVCDLKVVRSRDPVTGQVYAGPSVEEGQRRAAEQALRGAAAASS